MALPDHLSSAHQTICDYLGHERSRNTTPSTVEPRKPFTTNYSANQNLLSAQFAFLLRHCKTCLESHRRMMIWTLLPSHISTLVLMCDLVCLHAWNHQITLHPRVNADKWNLHMKHTSCACYPECCAVDKQADRPRAHPQFWKRDRNYFFTNSCHHVAF